MKRRVLRRTLLTAALSLALFSPAATRLLARAPASALAPGEARHPDAGAVEGPADPATVGQWTAPFPFPTIPIHSHLLPTGKVLFWDRHDVPENDGHPRLWDPASGEFTAVPDPPPGHDLFCSGHTFLEDGRLFVAGGHYSDLRGQPFAATFDPFRSSWSMLPEMNAGRWYPTATTLSTGEALILSGTDANGGSNLLPQVYRPQEFSWRNLTDAERDLPYYPLVFQAPNGKAFVVGPQAPAFELDTSGTGAWSAVANSGHGFRDYGSAVAYSAGKILFAGGGQPPTATVQSIDLLAPTPAFTELPPMAHARRQLNLTVLPDGSVLATGGTSADGFNNATGAVLATEIWSPGSPAWIPLAPIAEARLYHSMALLLPDGRVLVGGGGHPSDTEHGDSSHLNAQLFSPPYLFHGPRPTILAAPASVAFGKSFDVELGPETPVAALTFVRLGSVTHSFNMNQRFLNLVSTPSVSGRTVTAPSDPRLAPPGHYMLFALSATGVPSVAKIVRLTNAIFEDGFEDQTTDAWSTFLF
ncbi:MAG: galactose oxidase-like domain-containing protein [Thermoanaerobaculia bacterium]